MLQESSENSIRTQKLCKRIHPYGTSGTERTSLKQILQEEKIACKMDKLKEMNGRKQEKELKLPHSDSR